MFFGVFQLGPVQRFISCSRKLQDLWSSSYLLSFLSCEAMAAVLRRGGEIIYPSLEDQPLFSYVWRLGEEGKKPWECPPSDQELMPTLPNRFVCKLTSETVISCGILAEAEKTVRNTFAEFARKVKQEIEGKIKLCWIWEEIWNRQIEGFLEIYWVISPLNSENYVKSYQQAENLFGARKAVRDFNQTGEPGYKCTLCGLRQPLHHSPSAVVGRGEVRKFWNEMRRAMGYRFREGEHLCAVCTLKRLMPQYIFGLKAEFPSTSSMAVADFVWDVMERYRADETSFKKGDRDIIEDFVKKARNVRRQAGLDFDVKPLPRIERLAGGMPVLEKLSKLDGDWLINDTYTTLLRREEVDSAAITEAMKSLDLLVSRVDEVLKRQGLPRSSGPSKYYAIFQMDGDDMGDRIAKCRTEDEHREFSRSVSGFPLEGAIPIVEGKHLGKVIYFGGDEGIAMVSIGHLLPVLEECREEFQRRVGATASVGAVIAHHKQPLFQVLDGVRGALNTIKMRGKKGFCIALMKRSGDLSYGIAKWEYSGLKVIPLLQELVESYRKGWISRRWYHRLAMERLGLEGELDLAWAEIGRLVRRSADERGMPPSRIKDLVDGLRTLFVKLGDLTSFIALMDIAAFIAAGGGA